MLYCLLSFSFAEINFSFSVMKYIFEKVSSREILSLLLFFFFTQWSVQRFRCPICILLKFVNYIFAFFRRPMSGVTHGFCSFKGKVLELLSPNLVCRLIGSVACLGLLLAVVPLLLTE